ncbi:MAG: DotA/TraY family protein [Acidithiobacillus sp.]|nr:DotA/TraY family protein [Acidithiobacillus sp.]
MRKTKRHFLSLLAFALILFSWSLPGFASTFTPKLGSDDMLTSILAKTVGPSINQITHVGGTTAVSDITKLLMDINTLVLIVGGLLLTYVIGASVLKTAHEGEPMGQKWSSMWIPVKAAVGAALILPVSGLGGLSAAQGIVIWLLAFSIGAGDAAWDQVVKYVAKDPVGSVVVNPINTGQMAAGIMQSQVCASAINATANTYFPGSNPITMNGPTVEHTLNPVGDFTHAVEGYDEAVEPLPGGSAYATQYSVYQWTADSGGLLGDLSSMEILPSACGKTAYVSGAINPGTAAPGSTMVDTIGQDNGKAIGTLISSLSPISANVYAESKTGTNDKDFVKAINTYDTTMQKDIATASAKAVKGQVKKYEAAAKVDGFATAGEWFWDLVRWNSIAQKAADNLGDATGIDGGSFLGKIGSSKVAAADARIQSFIKQNGSLVGHIQPSSNGMSMIDSVFAEASTAIGSGLGIVSKNPLITVRNIGSTMEAAGGAVYAGDLILTGGAGAANGGIDGDVPVVGNATNAAAKIVYYDISPVLLGLAGVLFVEGFFLSFVVPLIPFMVWISALLGFLFMAFEMIVAAPLWAIMHMHPEGHEVVGLGASGYKMAFAIMTRPFLMIVGLVGGYALFIGFTSLIAPMIIKAVVSSQNTGGGFTGPFDMIGMVGLYVTLITIIAYECFKLVFVLPERVMNWASAGIQNYGEDSTLNQQKQSHEKGKGAMNTGHSSWSTSRNSANNTNAANRRGNS